MARARARSRQLDEAHHVGGDSVRARDVNEWLSAKAPPGDDQLELHCECGSPSCREFFSLTSVRYAEVRKQTGSMLVVRQHVQLDDDVVHEGDAVVVVRPRRSGT